MIPTFVLFCFSHFQNYFRDTWNIFDFITVLGSITEIIVDLQVSDCRDAVTHKRLQMCVCERVLPPHTT